MKKLFLFLLLLAAYQSQAQLSVPQRMYHLCKVWGYLKYHHPDHCAIKWNDLLVGRVDSVAAAPGDAAFQSILYNMCLQTGMPTLPALPIQADSAKNYQTGWFLDPALSAPVSAFLKNVEDHHRPDGSGCMVRVNDYTVPNYNSYIDFRYDTIMNVPGFSYANLRHRVLVYAYYWNTIKYFAPQIDIADHPWDSTLIQFMPDMLAVTTDSGFALALSRVVSRLDDSHGFYYNIDYWKVMNNVNSPQQQFSRLPLKIARVEGRHVVVASDVQSIHRGDIITKIDGIDADTFFSRRMQFYSASNPVTKYRIMYDDALYGPYGGSRVFELVDATNTARQATGLFNYTQQNYSDWLAANVDTRPEWEVSPCGYGYVNMGKITSAQVPAAYNALKNLPAIVFDIRNYPKGTAWDFKPLLFSQPNISARYFSPYLQYPGYYTIEDDQDNFGNWSNPDPYTGKVIILVNEETQSQAEYTAQILRTHPNAVILGSQTAGADGNISLLYLPGGIATYWTSLGWYQADWFNPQRAGVHIDTVVTPTIAGIRAGKDEVLAHALNCTLSVAQTGSSNPAYRIYTSGGYLYVKTQSGEPYEVALTDVSGRRLLQRESAGAGMEIATDNYAPGIYLVTISGKEGLIKRQKVRL